MSQMAIDDLGDDGASYGEGNDATHDADCCQDAELVFPRVHVQSTTWP